MARSGFKMKGNPMRRNFGIGGPMRKDEKETKTTTTTPEVDVMFGSLNDKGTKIVDEQGNWQSLTKGTEGMAVKNRAMKAGAISGGPDVQ
jgi:hypothetical protein